MGCATSVPIQQQHGYESTDNDDTSLVEKQIAKLSSTSNNGKHNYSQKGNTKDMMTHKHSTATTTRCDDDVVSVGSGWAGMLGMEIDSDEDGCCYGLDLSEMIAAEQERQRQELENMPTEQVVDMLTSSWAEFVQKAMTSKVADNQKQHSATLAMEYWTLQGQALDVLVQEWDRICEKVHGKGVKQNAPAGFSKVSMFQTVIADDDETAAQQVLRFLTEKLGSVQSLSIEEPRKPSKLSGDLAYSLFDPATSDKYGPQPCALLQHCLGELHTLHELHLGQVDLRGCGVGLEALLSHESCQLQELSLCHVLMDDEVVQALGRGLARHSSGSLQRIMIEGITPSTAPHLCRIHRLQEEQDERGPLLRGLNSGHLEYLVKSMLQSSSLGKSLEGLGLPGHDGLTGASCLDNLARLLEHCPNLQMLVLHQCPSLFGVALEAAEETDSGLSSLLAFCQALSHAQSLHTLDLSYTGIRLLDAAKPLMEALTVPNQIETLNLLQVEEQEESVLPRKNADADDTNLSHPNNKNMVSQAILEHVPHLTKLRILGAPLSLESRQTKAVLQAHQGLSELHIGLSDQKTRLVMQRLGYTPILQRNQIHCTARRIAETVPLKLWPHGLAAAPSLTLSCQQEQQEQASTPSVTYALLLTYGNQLGFCP